jgi:Flp pilus assembly protein TadD
LSVWIKTPLVLTSAILAGLFTSQAICHAQAPVTGAGPSRTATIPQHEQSTALAQARSLLNKAQFNEAEDSLRHYLDTHPSSADAHFLLGYVLFREIQAKVSQEGGGEDAKFEQHNAKASLVEYTAGAKYQTPGAFDLKIVALDYVLLHDYVDADKWLTRSVERDPKDSEAWYYLGRTKYNENRFEDAIRAFTQCVTLDPGNVKAEDNVGLSYAGLDRREEAMAAYQKAIAWQAQSLIKDSGPFIDLGSLLLEQDRVQEAIPYLTQAVSISPQESRAHAALGKAYSKQNELKKAQGELEKSVELAPDNASLHYVLGQVYRKQGLIDKAKVEFARSAELNGNSSSPVNDLPVKSR